MPNHSGQNGCSDHVHPDTPLTQLLSVSKTVLLQAVDLLDNYLTSDDQLILSSKYLPGSTIGAPPFLRVASSSLTPAMQENTCAMHAITLFY